MTWSDPTTPVIFAALPIGEEALCLADWQGRLTVGGEFSEVAGVFAENIAVYEDGVWSEPGGGVVGTVKALTDHDGDLVAAGILSQAGGVAVSNIAVFDGVDWQPLDCVGWLRRASLR